MLLKSLKMKMKKIAPPAIQDQAMRTTKTKK